MNSIEDMEPKQQASVTAGGHVFHMRLLILGINVTGKIFFIKINPNL